MIIALQLNAKQTMIIRMETETVQYAFSKSNLATSTPATRLDLADDIVHFHVLQRERPPRNAVTDAMFQSATLIQGKLSLTRLVFLWDHSKATDMKVRNWGYKVGPTMQPLSSPVRRYTH